MSIKVNPIPKRLLPNSVDYYEYIADTGEGSSFKSKAVLSNVKLDQELHFIFGSKGREVIGNAMLYYDCTNSSGLTDDPINESKIVFDGRTYYIVSVDILRTESIPHHYEILLK